MKLEFKMYVLVAILALYYIQYVTIKWNWWEGFSAGLFCLHCFKALLDIKYCVNILPIYKATCL